MKAKVFRTSAQGLEATLNTWLQENPSITIAAATQSPPPPPPDTDVRAQPPSVTGGIEVILTIFYTEAAERAESSFRPL